MEVGQSTEQSNCQAEDGTSVMTSQLCLMSGYRLKILDSVQTHTLDTLLGTPRSDMVHIDTIASATAAVDLSATHS